MERGPGDFAMLQMLLRKTPPQAPGERCDYCTEPVGPDHRHLIDAQARRIMCSCPSCYLVFQPSGAAQGRYKPVPTRYAHVDGFALDEAAWEALQIPIGLAFFFTNSSEGRTIALYPGPAGATESQLDLTAWNEIVAKHSVIGSLEADVEAVLVLRRNGATRAFVVPIDAAYRLVGIIRLSWKGFDGGEDAWNRIGAFFEEMAERSDGRVPAGSRW